MSGRSLACAEPLLVEAFPRHTQCGKKAFINFPLIIGLSCTVVLSLALSTFRRGGVHEPVFAADEGPLHQEPINAADEESMEEEGITENEDGMEEDDEGPEVEVLPEEEEEEIYEEGGKPVPPSLMRNAPWLPSTFNTKPYNGPTPDWVLDPLDKLTFGIGRKKNAVPSVKDCPPSDFIRKYALHLKKSGRITPPPFTMFEKTCSACYLAPNDPDWFYTRVAAMARQYYVAKEKGVRTLWLRRHFGKMNRKYRRPAKKRPALAKIINAGISQLERIGVVRTSPDKHRSGIRIISKHGQRELDLIAGQCLSELGYAVQQEEDAFSESAFSDDISEAT